MIILDILGVLLAIAALILLVPTVVLLVEVLASLAAKRSVGGSYSARPRIAVVMPAHNEAQNIRASIANVLSQLSEQDRLLVVADNCSDDTAEVARAAGAGVVERHDATRRGKGFALDFGLRHLTAAPPDVVVIVDADCLFGSGCLARIAGVAMEAGVPVQARYEMTRGSATGEPIQAIREFAWRVKNLVRPLGYRSLGLPCQLMGTGMAFPWSVISRSNLASSEIVEDLAFGLELARQGHAPFFCAEAVVISEFPATAEGLETQRTRWETGHLNIIAKVLPRMFKEAIQQRNVRLLALVLDAAVPPLSFLALSIASLLSVTLLLALWTGDKGGGLVLAISGFLVFACAALLAWWRVGRDIFPIQRLALVPKYVISKLDLYGRVLRGRTVGWIRTKRGGP